MFSFSKSIRRLTKWPKGMRRLLRENVTQNKTDCQWKKFILVYESIEKRRLLQGACQECSNIPHISL